MNPKISKRKYFIPNPGRQQNYKTYEPLPKFLARAVLFKFIKNLLLLDIGSFSYEDFKWRFTVFHFVLGMGDGENYKVYTLAIIFYLAYIVYSG